MSFAFQQCKNFENRLRFDKVIMKSLMLLFYGTQCIYIITHNKIHKKKFKKDNILLSQRNPTST